MAATRQPADAFTYVKQYLKSMPLESIGPALLDEVNKMLWMAAPWRWTLGSLPATTLVSNQQDYTIVTPTDFLFLFDGFVSDGANVFRNLQVEPTLPSDVKVVGNVSRLSYQGSNTYRTFPKPGTLPASPAQQFILRYKKVAPNITNQTQYTAGQLVMDDDWFWVFQAGVLWKAYQWGDDGRAGGVTIGSNGQAQYTGQLGAFRDGIRQMAIHEKLPLVEPNDLVNPKQTEK